MNKKGIEASENQTNSYCFWECYPITKEEAFGFVQEFMDLHLGELELLEDARESLLEISKRHKIFFITSRNGSHKEKTELFLKKNFPEFVFELFHSGDWHGGTKTKDAICRDLKITLLIEDSERAVDYANSGINIILLDKTWNRGVNHARITRVSNWKEILEEIKKIEEKENGN